MAQVPEFGSQKLKSSNRMASQKNPSLPVTTPVPTKSQPDSFSPGERYTPLPVGPPVAAPRNEFGLWKRDEFDGLVEGAVPLQVQLLSLQGELLPCQVEAQLQGTAGDQGIKWCLVVVNLVVVI